MYEAKTNKQVINLLSTGTSKTVPFDLMGGPLMYELQLIQSSLTNKPQGTTRLLKLSCKGNTLHLVVSAVYERFWKDDGIDLTYKVLIK